MNNIENPNNNKIMLYRLLSELLKKRLLEEGLENSLLEGTTEEILFQIECMKNFLKNWDRQIGTSDFESFCTACCIRNLLDLDLPNMKLTAELNPHPASTEYIEEANMTLREAIKSITNAEMASNAHAHAKKYIAGL